ncbi:MAG: aminopeptidase [Oscillospiraceae bacterium]|nr:aminopeptidase [Oscillospiraceae bacterium]
MEKTKGELLKEQLFNNAKDATVVLSEEEMKKVFDFCEPYKKFMDAAKIENEAVAVTVAMLEEKGYKPFEAGKKYMPGEKFYYNNRGRALIFGTMGTRPIEKGVKILASHIDSPRLDLKPTPVFERDNIAQLKTHYYGGVRKYQWVARELALHGDIYKKDGSVVHVNIGEDENDPVFFISDLLPHLAKDQNTRTLKDGIKGEELNVWIGTMKFRDDKVSEKVKLNVLNILFEKYGIIEPDFFSAELTLVPASKARDIGLDRSLIGAYGHDDRVCAYTSMMAELDYTNENPEWTSVVVFADKEEVGSDSNTGLHSAFMEYFIADLAAPYGVPVRTVLSNSKCLSADVSAAFDPTFPEVLERNNASYLNHGVSIMKYTGSGGKGGTNDCYAKFASDVRRLLDNAGVIWQTGELGKVDQGGGGTVAKFVSALDVDTIDIGVPVIAMHAPIEVVAKTDVYSTYRAFYEFLKAEL